MNGQTVNQQRKISEIETAWLAGFWDGEGSIGMRVQKYHPKGRHTYFAPYAQVTNTHLSTLEKVDEILTGLRVGHHIRWKEPRGFRQESDTKKYKPLWSIKIDGMKRCKTLLLKLLPYLVTKRSDAETVWDFIRSREASHYKHLPYTEHELNLVNKFRIGGRKGKPMELISLNRSTTTR